MLNKLIPLTTVPEGSGFISIKIDCGQKLALRLQELGLYEGAKVTVIKNDFWGPVILQVFHSQIALGRGQADKIYGYKID